MEKTNKELIKVEVKINAPLLIVWKNWVTPEDIVNWNAASKEWHTVKSENDLKIGGKFSSRMEAKDGSMGFDFWGTYTYIKENEKIEYTLGDERKVSVKFSYTGDSTLLEEEFEAETENPAELQQFGWQAILNNFKKHVEEQL